MFVVITLSISAQCLTWRCSRHRQGPSYWDADRRQHLPATSVHASGNPRRPCTEVTEAARTPVCLVDLAVRHLLVSTSAVARHRCGTNAGAPAVSSSHCRVSRLFQLLEKKNSGILKGHSHCVQYCAVRRTALIDYIEINYGIHTVRSTALHVVHNSKWERLLQQNVVQCRAVLCGTALIMQMMHNDKNNNNTNNETRGFFYEWNVCLRWRCPKFKSRSMP